MGSMCFGIKKIFLLLVLMTASIFAQDCEKDIIKTFYYPNQYGVKDYYYIETEGKFGCSRERLTAEFLQGQGYIKEKQYDEGYETVVIWIKYLPKHSRTEWKEINSWSGYMVYYVEKIRTYSNNAECKIEAEHKSEYVFSEKEGLEFIKTLKDGVSIFYTDVVLLKRTYTTSELRIK